MKNRLFIIPLSLMFLFSCGSQSVSGVTAEMARALAVSMRKVQEAYNGYAYTSSFALEYHASYQTDNEYQTSTVTQDYLAEASLMAGYTLDMANGEGFDLGRLFNRGAAYFEGSQKETNKISHEIQVKNGFNKGDQSFTEDYSYHHPFGIEFNQEELKARGYDSLQDSIDPSKDRAEAFSGKISREIVKEYAKEAVESAFRKIIYLEAWSNVSAFRSSIASYFENLSLESDKEVSSFVHDNNVKLSEENGLIKAEFALKGSEVLSYISKKANSIKKSIPCSCTIDPEKKILTKYEFDFKGVFDDLLSSEKGGKKQYEYSVERFYLRGASSDIPFSQLKLDGDFQEYTKENSSDFMQGFLDYVIPHVAK